MAKKKEKKLSSCYSRKGGCYPFIIYPNRSFFDRRSPLQQRVCLEGREKKEGEAPIVLLPSTWPIGWLPWTGCWVHNEGKKIRCMFVWSKCFEITGLFLHKQSHCVLETSIWLLEDLHVFDTAFLLKTTLFGEREKFLFGAKYRQQNYCMLQSTRKEKKHVLFSLSFFCSPCLYNPSINRVQHNNYSTSSIFTAWKFKVSVFPR